jgi:glycerol kinase
MKQFILAIDQGTTSTRAILFNRQGKLVYNALREVTCLYPKPGWVEQNALQLLISATDVINEVLILADISMDDIDSIGITNQRETSIVWEKNTGKPVYNAIVWQSKESQEICDKLKKYEEIIHLKTGLKLNPYFSASKIRFILDHIPDGQKRAENGELLFGTVDSWLVYKMTKGKVHATDVSNASRTLLYNIHDLKWDDELLRIFNIPKCMLPEVKSSSDDYGQATYFDCDVHITGVAGDQQAALFGQTCFDSGESKNTYGTGCFMLMNTGDKAVISNKGLLTTIAWKLDGKVTYALEGSVFVGGAVVQWLRDELSLIKSASQSEEYANRVSDSEGVYVVPAFVGLGTPYWDDDARGAIFGLTRGSSKYHIIRACLESIAFQSKDVIEVMKKEAHLKLLKLKVDGGATANSVLLQFQSDILRCEIHVPECLETTALGASYLAGLYTGFWKDLNDIKASHNCQKIFLPKMSKQDADQKYRGWKKAIKATRTFKI